MVDDQDQALVRQCLDGHTRAFEALVDRYQKPLFNVALRMLDDVQDAEDITQTVFIKAFEKLATYNHRYKFFSWIYRMTVNEALNFIKRQRRFEALDVQMIAYGETPDERLASHELSDRIGTALLGLKPEDRAIVILKHFEGFSYKDIGYILEVPEKTVKSKLYTARQRLKDILVKQGFVQNNG